VVISQAESVVMEVLWEKSPRTAEDVVQALSQDQDWEEATIRTLLHRLTKKGAVATEKEGRRYLYRPLIARKDYVGEESQSLLDRLFDGRLGPLCLHFSQERKLTPEDIADLKKLIAEIEDGG
jgi:BlaI family penicillinase repressor